MHSMPRKQIGLIRQKIVSNIKLLLSLPDRKAPVKAVVNLSLHIILFIFSTSLDPLEKCLSTFDTTHCLTKGMKNFVHGQIKNNNFL